MSRLVGKHCNLGGHWSRYQRNHLGDLSGVEIYFLEQVDDPGPSVKGYPTLRKLQTGGWWTWGAWATWTQCKGATRRMMQLARLGGLEN